ncbi:LamG-like jellyroll fold domain-containing protein [Hymenobacter negativus]|uniref:LamG-like jellyroll fold domain-containing protein n=1 Tax=Hymenobacter negativus TaxID=2795026 RepID=A0ABS3Q9A5_9BACT|nr:LamG-like jellyroll fold domain-containing protein [Hymenobacter negativus]MBO2007716.1 hypothetical protein [Hymenobacter negativus]
MTQLYVRIQAWLLGILFLCGSLPAVAQNTWTQKANYGGGGRYYATSFSIGSKGYIGMGYTATARTTDFWEYNPATNVWTQKADYAGYAPTGAVGFSIGSKGYMGVGFSSNSQEFFEYDPAANVWTRKADFAGGGRQNAVAFSIGSKGYVGTGTYSNNPPLKDFWEYNPATDTWTQKTDFPGAARYQAAGFSIGSKGYIGTGFYASNGTTKDFYEYDPATNAWTRKADIGGTERYGAAGFNIGSLGYICAGTNTQTAQQTNDVWQYDPGTNTWTQKTASGGGGRVFPVGFSIGSKGYIGTGLSGNTYAADFWEYTPSAAAPSISSFSPGNGPVGTSVVLTGTNLTGATSVTFNGTAATSFTVNSATQITVSVPTGATTGIIAVATPGGTATSASTFAVAVPSVASVTRLTPSPTAMAQVSFRVTFSVSVTGVTASNFTLTPTGTVSSASVAGVSGSGTTYTVTVNTGTGDGTLLLNVANSTGLSATMSNTPYTAGELYTIIKSFAAAPQLILRGAGSASGSFNDVTAFVDAVQVLQGGTAFTNGLTNGTFETSNVAAGSFQYAGSVVAAPWSFAGNVGVSRNSSGFGSTAAQGDAVGLLQTYNGAGGSLAQNLAVPTGSYQVNFQAVQRSNNGPSDQVVNVFLNNGTSDVFIGTTQPSSNTSYSAFTSATFSVTAPALAATISSTASNPTTTSPIPVTVTFSASVGTTFTASDVTVGNGTLSGFSGSGSTYTFNVTPAAFGTVTVNVAAAMALDANNTGNTAAPQFSIQYSQPVTATPAVAAPGNGALTNLATPTYSGTAVANSTVTVYVDGTSIGTTTATGGSWSLAQPTALAQGAHTVRATAQLSGQAVSASSNTNTFTVDSVRPTVAISSTASNPTNTTPIPVTVTFSEGVTGFVAGNVSVTNGTIIGFTGVSGSSTYTFTVTPTTAGTATTVNVVANVAQDAAGNGNTAATPFSVTYQLPTSLSCVTANNALNFDGADDYVRGTTPLPALTALTLEGWVYQEANSGLRTLLNGDDFPGGAVHIHMTNGAMQFTVNGSSPSDYYASTGVALNTWAHVAVVYTSTGGAGGTVKFYLNGAPLNTVSAASTVAIASQNYSVGAWFSGGPQRFFDGSLNELRVWSVARTDAQIAANYQAQLSAQTGLIACYSFNQGTANGTNTTQTTLADDSGSGRTGTLTGFALTTGSQSNYVTGNNLNQTLAITGFTPTSGVVGQTITLTGTGFTGATGVSFNGTAATTFAVVNSTTITATVPAGATSGNLRVTTACGTVASPSAFTLCTTAPVAVAQNASVTLSVSGNATLAATAVNNGSTANCSPAAAASLSVSPSSFSCTDAVPATVASALTFNGTNQYISLPTTAIVPVGNSAYTIEAWIKPTQMGVYGIIGWGEYGTSNQVNALRLSANGLINYWWGPDLIVSTPSLVGAWHHVAATFNGTTRTIYLDGVAVGSDTPGSHTVPDARNLRIGVTNTNGPSRAEEYFPGSIDEVRVWNVGRTAAQINAAKGVGLPGSTPGLVAYYRLNEASGLTAADATGNAANLGTLTNGPTWTPDAAPVVNGLPVTLTVTDGGGNTATAPAVVTVTVPVTPTTTWTGSTSTAWTDCANWSYGKVPDATTSAVVPAGLARYPVLATGTFPVQDLTINASSSLTLNGGATLQVNGNLANSGTATLSGTVAFVGSTATQTLSNGSGFTTLVVNKPSGTVQLGQTLTINSALTLTSGTLTTASYQVNLGGSATLSETDASYVVGKVVANRSLVPGTAESFSGLGLTLTPAAGSVAPGATLVTRTTGTAIAGAGTSQSILRNFDIRPATNAGLSVTMNFSYFPHERNGIPVANLALFKSVSGGTPWIPQRGTTAAGNVVTKTGIADFSVWTLGNSANPLPVELTDFTAALAGPAAVRLAWTTASEKNSAAFEVERSVSGTAFERIGTVAAASASSAPRTYELLDAKLPGGAALLYYRLKQVDADGTFAYSPVRTVALTGTATGLAVYPNPAHGGAATLTGAEPGTRVMVFDALGRPVLAATADATGTAALVLPAGLPAGVYVVRAGSKAVRLSVE